MSMDFDPTRLSPEDRELASSILHGKGNFSAPDLVIAPNRKPYLYRWHIVHKQTKANVYLHIQVASDPERPLHDHPWDNTSVILSGGYDEMWSPQPWLDEHHPSREPYVRQLRARDMIHRRASEAHRLILPSHLGYTMSLFSTGPRIREWGFWFPDRWRPFTEVTKTEDNMSVHIGVQHDDDHPG